MGVFTYFFWIIADDLFELIVGLFKLTTGFGLIICLFGLGIGLFKLTIELFVIVLYCLPVYVLELLYSNIFSLAGII